LAPVSGTVTLNGEPLAGADVHFQPIGSKENPNPGPGSHAKTDDQGRYSLRVDERQAGAVVGKHRVMIFAYTHGTTGRQPDAGGGRRKDRIPLKYNENSVLTCAVPTGGRTDADFRLTVP
jgi:hypothetical protein